MIVLLKKEKERKKVCSCRSKMENGLCNRDWTAKSWTLRSLSVDIWWILVCSNRKCLIALGFLGLARPTNLVVYIKFMWFFIWICIVFTYSSYWMFIHMNSMWCDQLFLWSSLPLYAWLSFTWKFLFQACLNL